MKYKKNDKRQHSSIYTHWLSWLLDMRYEIRDNICFNHSYQSEIALALFISLSAMGSVSRCYDNDYQ